MARSCLLRQQGGDAACGIAAGPGLGAIRIQNPHEHIRTILVRFQNHQLVAAYAQMAVRNPAGDGGGQVEGCGPPVQHHKIIARAMHF